jgi:hypothetical protein
MGERRNDLSIPTEWVLPRPVRRTLAVCLLVAAAVVSCSVFRGSESRRGAELRADSTVTVSADRVLGRFDNPAWYGNQNGPTSPLGPRDLRALDALDVHVARVWALPRGYYHATTRRYDFDFAADDGSTAYRYLDQPARYARRLLVNLGECAPRILTLSAPQTCRAVLRDGLVAYKRRYPSIQYVELFNEPDKTGAIPSGHWEGLTVEDYYRWYRIGYSVVNEVNHHLHPAVLLRLGGPATATFDESFLRGFLDRYARDHDPAKRLDFISYHQYKHRADPARVGAEKQTVRRWLSRRRLDPDTPVFVTEYGVFPGDASGTTLSADLLTQAAAMETLAYYYINSGMDLEMHWAYSHPTNPRKSMFVSGIDGAVYPYGDLVTMQSMMKDQRVPATSDGLSRTGIGVNALATVDSSGLAVLITNYQGSRGEASHVVSLYVDRLPPRLAHRRLQVDLYLVDSTHSNYAHDPSSSTLERVERRIVRADDGIQTAFRLEPNAVTLVVISTNSDEPDRPTG